MRVKLEDTAVATSENAEADVLSFAPPSMIPATLPIFPLPGAVVFPGVIMPLHIFELRYRAMVEDALAGERVIGMVLLRPGYEHDYEGRPPVFGLGCAGGITRVQRMADGRFNIVLRGIGRFRITGEEAGRRYRLARTAPVPESEEPPSAAFALQRQRLLGALAKVLASANGAEVAAAVPDADLVNGLAQDLDLEPLERQALLEQPTLLARCMALADLLEMKAHLPPEGRARNVLH